MAAAVVLLVACSPPTAKPSETATAVPGFEVDAAPANSDESHIRDMVRGRADHAPFAEKGIPHLFFSTSEHDDYHRPTDTLDKVDPRIVRRIARAVTRSLLAYDAGALSRRPLRED